MMLFECSIIGFSSRNCYEYKFFFPPTVGSFLGFGQGRPQPRPGTLALTLTHRHAWFATPWDRCAWKGTRLVAVRARVRKLACPGRSTRGAYIFISESKREPVSGKSSARFFGSTLATAAGLTTPHSPYYNQVQKGLLY